MYLKINTLGNCPNCKKSSVITGKNWVKIKALLPKMVKKKPRNNYAAGGTIGKQLGGAMNE